MAHRPRASDTGGGCPVLGHARRGEGTYEMGPQRGPIGPGFLDSILVI